ncbi:MAG: hypothetical protein Q8916_03925 [Bacteroidota bacterium]|nr:hypothetical protein [Bacteroidota bacterium]MDP4229536.1 hypothetical protein [Bacteroidota bacterium]MDP4236546.1 hypothetical protein [Bacteroidota bacterium]
MLKSIVSVFLTSVVVMFFAVAPASAQKKEKPAQQTAPRPANPTPKDPKIVAADAPPPQQPALALNVPELKFGAQGVGVQSCMYVNITNTSAAAQTMIALSTDDEKNYSIPSPSHQMLPISIQPRTNVTISVCFKPGKIGDYKTRLVIKTPQDSFVIPVEGKAIRPEDVGKLPKTDLSISKGKKKRTWNIKLQLVSPAKITLQLSDELGAMKMSFLSNDFKNEGAYEFLFNGTDKDKKKLPPGKYYLRCVIEDIARGNVVTKFTKVIEIPD